MVRSLLHTTSLLSEDSLLTKVPLEWNEKKGNKRDNFVFNYTIICGPSAFVITRQRKKLLFDGLGIFKSPVNCCWLTLNSLAN